LGILWILAHPDDESFGGAGMFAWARQQGIATGLVCATRGEVGAISDPALATPITLGAVREQELRGAMNVVELTDLRLMGYRDSGMAGTPENDDPRALINAPREETIAHLVGQIRELRPETVITFGPDGVYGHPDHVYIGDVASEAVLEAAKPTTVALGEPWKVSALYHVAVPRDVLIAYRNRPDGPFRSMSEEEVQRLGTPAEEITHWLDTINYIDVSRRTVLHHATQISSPADIAGESPQATARLRYQQLKRMPLPWDETPHIRDAIDRLQEQFPNRSRSLTLPE
jgi:LmbE family N-acetylglucosaminyl deacetylase